MPFDEQDIILLERLKAGDEEAFSYIYTKHYVWLAVVAMPLLKDEAEVQDLVQEFFIDFLQKKLFLQIGPPYNIKYYLNTAVRNRCLDKIRRKSVSQKRMDNALAGFPSYQPPEILMETQERQREIGVALKAAIQQVPALSAKVFTLAYIENKSRDQIATEMGVSPHTVKNQLVRAIKILRTRLKNI